jgi:hypothetical protein
VEIIGIVDVNELANNGMKCQFNGETTEFVLIDTQEPYYFYGFMELSSEDHGYHSRAISG